MTASSFSGLSGETHRYLGKQYRLRIRQGSLPSVKLTVGFLWMTVPRPGDVRRLRQLVDSWYRTHAVELFERRLKICHDRVKHHGVPFPALKLRRMKTRWGSCGKNGSVMLNPALVRLPVPCIDYLIIHELCHLKIHHHGSEFYRLLDKCLPDWSARRERLNLAAVQN
jgi:predicted metal-dependent hydrolase